MECNVIARSQGLSLKTWISWRLIIKVLEWGTKFDHLVASMWLFIIAIRHYHVGASFIIIGNLGLSVTLN